MQGDIKRVGDPLLALDRLLAAAGRGAAAHDIVGVSPGASPQDVQRAYFDLARQLHPDQTAIVRGGRIDDATRAMALLNQARDIVLNGQPERPKAAEPANGAQTLIQSAQLMVDNRRWAEAEHTLAQARALLGGNTDSRCDTLFAWAMWNNPDRPADAREAEATAVLLRVTERQGQGQTRALAHYYLALSERRRGHDGMAMQHARKAVALDSKLREADSLLRLLERRRQRGDAPVASGRSRGFWRRLFGRG